MTDYDAAEREMDAMEQDHRRKAAAGLAREAALRTALERIAALQPEDPRSDDYETDTGYARAYARYQAAEIARAALAVSK